MKTWQKLLVAGISIIILIVVGIGGYHLGKHTKSESQVVIVGEVSLEEENELLRQKVESLTTENDTIKAAAKEVLDAADRYREEVAVLCQDYEETIEDLERQVRNYENLTKSRDLLPLVDIGVLLNGGTVSGGAISAGILFYGKLGAFVRLNYDFQTKLSIGVGMSIAI